MTLARRCSVPLLDVFLVLVVFCLVFALTVFIATLVLLYASWRYARRLQSTLTWMRWYTFDELMDSGWPKRRTAMALVMLYDLKIVEAQQFKPIPDEILKVLLEVLMDVRDGYVAKDDLFGPVTVGFYRYRIMRKDGRRKKSDVFKVILKTNLAWVPSR